MKLIRKLGRPPSKDKKVSTSIALSPTALHILDRQRGKESRSVYIEKLIRGVE